MIGTQLEQNGWRQGAIVKQHDVSSVLAHAKVEYDDKLILVVASQSCDIASKNIELDPIIEFSVARNITKLDGNCTYNKNPRILHTTISICSNDINIIDNQYIELKAFEKFSFSKHELLKLQPDTSRIIEDMASYIDWLSARYKRIALPTEFNNRIAAVEGKTDRRRKIAKENNQHLSGIYIQVTPNIEITADQSYCVNLLGLVMADFKDDRVKVKAALEKYAQIMRDAGMDVTCKLQSEDEVSYAMMRHFQRFSYDDLSHREHTVPKPLPV